MREKYKEFVKNLFSGNFKELNISFDSIGYLIKVNDIKDRTVILLTKEKKEIKDIINIIFENKEKILKEFYFSEDFFNTLKISIYKINDIKNIENIKINNKTLNDILIDENLFDYKNEILEYIVRYLKNNICNIKFKYITNYFSNFNKPYLLIDELNFDNLKINNKILSFIDEKLFNSDKIININNDIKKLKKFTNIVNRKIENGKQLNEVFNEKFIKDLDYVVNNLISNISV